MAQKRSRTATPKKSQWLPEKLAQPEVLLGCLFRWTAVAYTDRPAEVEALLRAALPPDASASEKREAAKPLLHHIGIVRWSEAQQCLWFRQGNSSPFRVHASRLTDEQRARVATMEPTRPIRDGHSAGNSRAQ